MQLEFQFFPIIFTALEMWVTEMDSWITVYTDSAIWKSNQWKGYYLETVHGERYLIEGNTSNSIYPNNAFKYEMCVGDTFVIVKGTHEGPAPSNY